MEEFHQTPKSPIPQRLRGLKEALLNHDLTEQTRKPLEVKDDDSTIFHSDKHLNISISQSLHLEDMCREITSERGKQRESYPFSRPRSCKFS